MLYNYPYSLSKNTYPHDSFTMFINILRQLPLKFHCQSSSIYIVAESDQTPKQILYSFSPWIMNHDHPIHHHLYITSQSCPARVCVLGFGYPDVISIWISKESETLIIYFSNNFVTKNRLLMKTKIPSK